MTDPRALVVWVPTKLVSTANRPEHWAVRAKRVKIQRAAVKASVLSALHAIRFEPAAKAKSITLTGHMTRRLDPDNFVSACKAIVDGLRDAKIIHDDGPDSGHVFEYHQRVAKPTGVEIRVELA